MSIMPANDKCVELQYLSLALILCIWNWSTSCDLSFKLKGLPSSMEKSMVVAHVHWYFSSQPIWVSWPRHMPHFYAKSKSKIQKNLHKTINTSLLCSHNIWNVISILTNDFLGKAFREVNAFNQAGPYHTSSCNVQYFRKQNRKVDMCYLDFLSLCPFSRRLWNMQLMWHAL